MNIIKKIAKSVFPQTYESLRINYHEPSRYKNLYSTIKKIKPKSIVEVGTWNGKRAVKMIECAQKYNDVTYYGFDLFEDLTQDKYIEELSKKPPTMDEVLELLNATGAVIKLYKGDTIETLKTASDQLINVDFVYIDGGHSVETIQNDWNSVEKLMHNETMVIFDDYWRNRTDGGCKTVVDAIDKKKYKVEILPEINVFDNKDFGRLDISYARVELQS